MKSDIVKEQLKDAGVGTPKSIIEETTEIKEPPTPEPVEEDKSEDKEEEDVPSEPEYVAPESENEEK